MREKNPRLNWVDQAIGFFAPEAGLRRARARALSGVLLNYEGAKMGRRTEGWITSGTSANAENWPALAPLRNRSRDLVRNNPLASKALNVIVANAVGTGIIPQARTGDPATNAKLDAAFARWSEQCDADGQLEFYGLQGLIARSIVESGECVIRFRNRRPQDNLDIPFQLQVLEPDFIDSNKTAYANPSGGLTISGVIFDKIGRRTGYWLFSHHPGDIVPIVPSSFVSNVVDAKDVLHAYQKTRPQQVRGVPWMTPIMLRLRDVDDYEDAELVRKKIEACFAAFVTQADDNGMQLAPAHTDAKGNRIESFEPGMIEYLKSGEQVTFAEPAASAGYAEYIRTQQRAIAAGIGVTYEQLTGDLSQVNYSSYRAGHLEFNRLIEGFRWHTVIPMVLNPIWRRFIDTAVITGLIREPNYGVEWTTPTFESVDPRKDAEAQLMRIRSGTQTLMDAIASQGNDPAKQLERIAETNKLLDKLGLILDSDPRKTGAAAVSQEEQSGNGNGNGNQNN
jgi:lambda family phage portal protein